MTSTRFALSTAVALALLAWTVAPARSDEKGWTIGAAQGEADYHAQVSDFDDGSILSGDTDSHELGWKLYGGYRFNKWLAVELGYVELQNDFDDPTFEGFSDGTGARFASLGNGPVSVGFSPSGVFAEAVGSVPLGGRLYALGKVGLFAWENEIRVQDLDGESRRDESGTDPVFGAGVEFRFRSGLSLRAEYEIFTGVVDEDIDLITAGVSYRF